MQDRISRVVETSCTARPDHTVGQILPPPNVRGMSVIPPKAAVNADIFVRPVRANKRHPRWRIRRCYTVALRR
jgi:hypothetical protein